jgi:hypothetical protein
MVSYFLLLMVLLLLLVTICALVGHFMFGFYTKSEVKDPTLIHDWVNLPNSFISVLDTFLGDQWGDNYRKQQGRHVGDNRSRRIVLAVFFMATVIGLGVIYAAVFIAVLIFKVGHPQK